MQTLLVSNCLLSSQTAFGWGEQFSIKLPILEQRFNFPQISAMDDMDDLQSFNDRLILQQSKWVIEDISKITAILFALHFMINGFLNQIDN